MPNIKSFYVSVLSQALSPCEGFLAAGTNFGNVNIFNIRRLYELDDEGNPIQQASSMDPPHLHFPVNSKPVQAMISSESHLIVGGKNCLHGFNWEQLTSPKAHHKAPKPDWTIDFHLPTDFGTKETVDCVTQVDQSSAFAACGDNNIYHVDLEYGKTKMALSNHSDFIHSISYFENQLATGSEDGTVCIWDTRKSKPVHVITPQQDAKLNRPNLGKWIGAVALNDDWLVCGGGPRLAMYHLRSFTMSKVLLEASAHGINTVNFHEDNIVVGVNGPNVYHVLFSGDVTVQMPTTPLRVYSLTLQKNNDNKLMTVGGASGDIDICTGFKLQDRVVRCVA